MTIARISKKKLAQLDGKKVWSTISKRSGAPRKSNPKRVAKRKAGYRKMLSGKEYKAARAEAMERAGNRCEVWLSWTDRTYVNNAPPIPFNYTGVLNATTTHVMRCPSVEDLHAHHKSYPKTRPLEASDLTICCKPHHEYLESQKMGKTRMY